MKTSPIKKISNKKEKDNGKIPTWMECSWRRKACGLDECPICGRINKDRKKHLSRGEDPDSMESVIEDVGKQFKETMSMVKKDAKKMGINLAEIEAEDLPQPPAPREYPIYNKVMEWRSSVYKLTEESDDTSSAWLFTEAAEDLLWYSNTLSAKIYRQLSNRWEKDNGDEFGDSDYEYTGYVLREVLALLKKSLNDLIALDCAQNNQFNLALLLLAGMEKDIRKI